MTTVAPAITAPLGSLTTPVTVPALPSDCASPLDDRASDRFDSKIKINKRFNGAIKPSSSQCPLTMSINGLDKWVIRNKILGSNYLSGILKDWMGGAQSK